MNRTEEIHDFIDGRCLVEYHGNYYEYIGNINGKMMLADTNDGYCICKSFDDLLEDKDFQFVR